MRGSFPALWLAVFTAAGFGLLGALADLPRSPAHEAQLFFADHALRDWWGRFDTRWYGGVDVTLVPSVLARLAALLARVPGLGLERAWAGLLAITGAAFGLGVARLASAHATSRPAGFLLIGVAATPLVWVALIPAGEPAVVLSLALALNAVAWTREGSAPLDLASSLVLAAGAVAAHPVGLVALAGCAPLFLRAGLRQVLALALGVSLGAVAAQDALWADSTLQPRLVLPVWVAHAVLAVGAVALVSLLARRAFAASALAALSLLVGLLADVAPAQVTSLAALTVAAALALLAVALEDLPPGGSGLAVAGLVFALGAGALGWYRAQDTRGKRQALKELEWALANVEGGERFRFVTLGVGPEWIELSRRVRPDSLDGALEGGLPSWDRVDLSQPSAVEPLLARLTDASASVRWVVTGRPDAAPLLTPLGFSAVSAWRGNVTLWERASTAPLDLTRSPRVKAPWRVTVLTPLLGVASLFLLLLAAVRLRRGTNELEVVPEPTLPPGWTAL